MGQTRGALGSGEAEVLDSSKGEEPRCMASARTCLLVEGFLNGGSRVGSGKELAGSTKVQTRS